MGSGCGCGCKDSGAAGPGVAAPAGGGRAMATDQTVESLVRGSPRASEILRGLGIDTCCGGRLTLSQAAASAGVPLTAVLAALGTDATATP